MAVGITTWIKDDLLKGIPFTRRGCRGMGKPADGLLNGRKIDLAFKGFCTTGKAPPGTKAWVVRRISAIQKSLAKAGVQLHAANVFVKIGQLKTHLDGVGTHRASGEVVVLELKSTQSTLASHRAAYDIPCSIQPTIRLAGCGEVANTERMHHALQLAFGVHGLESAKRGFVIISASDGAALYPLNRGISLKAFVSPITLSIRAPKAAKKKRPQPKSTAAVKWPGCSVALPGWRDVRRIRKSVYLVQKGSTTALATAVRTRGETAAAVKVLRALQSACDSTPTKLLVARPAQRKWICHSTK